LPYRFIKPSDQSLVLILAIRRRTLAMLAEQFDARNRPSKHITSQQGNNDEALA
jgi:hypothetical protein